MTTQKLLNNQKEMIESYETAFSHFPHHDTTVHIIVWSPFLLEIIYCTYIIYLSFQPEIPTIVSHTAVYFPLYLTIYGLFPILFPSFCAITLIIELNRYHALLTIADCRTLLKKLKEQTELAIKILTSDTDNDDFCYSFQNILFADDVFSTIRTDPNDIFYYYAHSSLDKESSLPCTHDLLRNLGLHPSLN